MKNFYVLKFFFKQNLRQILVGAIALLLIFNASFFKIVTGLRNKTKLEKRVIALNSDIKNLKIEIHNLQKSGFYIEKLARKNQAMYKEHETVYRFRADEK